MVYKVISVFEYSHYIEYSQKKKKRHPTENVDFMMSWLMVFALVAAQQQMLTQLANEVLRDCLLSVSTLFSLCLMCEWLILELVVL